MEPTFVEVLLLVAAAALAGWVDAIAGGGGLITVPALLAVGLPPELALGTNKGQAVFGSSTALWRFARAGLVDRAGAPRAFVLGFLGSAVGAAGVIALDPSVLRPVVLVLLVAVAVFLTLRRTPTLSSPPPPSRARWIAMALALGVGAYDGFFGPGTGTFLIMGQVMFLGVAMTRASANAKVVNFASNLAAVTLFGLQGAIVWAYALPMAGAQLAGAWAGAHSTVRLGDGLVRRVVLVVSVLLVVKVAHDLLAGS